jgi:signal transduction histidine kinase
MFRPEPGPEERLNLLLSTGRMLASRLEVQEVLDALMDQVIEVIRAERGFVMLYRQGEGWEFRSARGLDVAILQSEDFRVSRKIADQVARQGVTILTSDAVQDDRFSAMTSVGLYNLRSILCVPLLLGGRTLGVIYADHRLEKGAFSSSDTSLLEAIAGQAAVALENAWLVERLKQVHESALQQARRELAETQGQLLQASKLASLGQLAAGLAHEFNSPLGALTLNLSGMQAQKQEQDPALARRLGMCLGAVQRCQHIVARMLNFATPPSPAEVEVDVGQVLATTLDIVEADLLQRNLKVERQISHGLYVRGDSQALSQAFLNLLLNARDSFPSPSPLPTIWVRAGRLPSQQVVAEVEDNGEGMETGVLQRIFEPFFTTRPPGQGVGLGLSVAYQIVCGHSGQIQAESQPSLGTRMRVIFPGGQPG